MLPEAKQLTTKPYFYFSTLYLRTFLQIVSVFIDLDRNQEAHEMATEAVAFAKAKFGLENVHTLRAVNAYAVACMKLGRVEEAKANFKNVLTIQTRVFGREHPSTQITRECIQIYGCVEPSG